jgi:uncharacterized protein (DUF58 family)
MARLKQLKRLLLAVQDGLGLLAVSVALFAVATNTQTGWLFLPSAFILVVLASHLWAARSLHRSDILASFRCELRSTDLQVGQPGLVMFDCRQPQAEKVLEQFDLHLRGALLGRCSLSCLRDSAGVLCEVVPNKRGIYPSLSAELVCYRPLGWLTLFRTLQVDCRMPILVGPELVELNIQEWRRSLATASLRPELRMGASQSNLAASDEFERLREYVPGDDTRQIHWLTSARSGSLVVRHATDSHSDQQVLALFVDVNQASSGNEWEQAFENLVKLAASICHDWSFCFGAVRLFCNEQGGWSEVSISHEFWAGLSASSRSDESGALAAQVSTLTDGPVQLAEIPQRILLTTNTVQSSISETVIVVSSNFEALSLEHPELFQHIGSSK